MLRDQPSSGRVEKGSVSAWGAYWAELIGTFGLVFAITATATSAGLGHPISGSSLGSLAVVLVNGIALGTMVAAVGAAVLADRNGHGADA